MIPKKYCITYLDRLLVFRFMIAEIPQLQAACPVLLVEIHKHRLFDFTFPVVNRDRVVMPIQTVYQGLNAGLLDVSDIGGSLPWLNPHDDCSGRNSPESIYYDFPFDRLNRINHDGDSSRVHHFECLLGVDIHTRQPAAKAWM